MAANLINPHPSLTVNNMSSINIKGTSHSYNEAEVITFAEGLIGLPQIRRAVVVSMDEFKPFCWLAPLDNDQTRFVVVNPHEIFEGYEPGQYKPQLADRDNTYAIVTVGSDWRQTTINLRAPIVVDPATKIASQQILSDSPYHFAETLPQD